MTCSKAPSLEQGRAGCGPCPGSCLMVHSVTSCFRSFSSLVKLKDETLERGPTTKQQVCPEHLLRLRPVNMPCGNSGEKTY